MWLDGEYSKLWCGNTFLLIWFFTRNEWIRQKMDQISTGKSCAAVAVACRSRVGTLLPYVLIFLNQVWYFLESYEFFLLPWRCEMMGFFLHTLLMTWVVELNLHYHHWQQLNNILSLKRSYTMLINFIHVLYLSWAYNNIRRNSYG